LRAARAPTAISGRIKNIRPEIAVIDQDKDGLGLHLYKIADSARTVSRPCAIGCPRGRLLVRAMAQHRNSDVRDSTRHV
jgi:hypothetical protein